MRPGYHHGNSIRKSTTFLGGGGGSNAIDRMMETRVEGVEFWAVNTDAQALGRSKAKGTDSDDITL